MSDVYEIRKQWRRSFVADVTPMIVAKLSKLEPDKGWRLEPLKDDDYGPDNVHPAFITNDGDRLWLSIDDAKHRIEVIPSYGQLPNGRQWIPRDDRLDDVRVSISADKAPSDIANDISRRVLTIYRANLAAYRFRVQSATDYHNRTEALAAELTELSGGKIVFPRSQHRNTPTSEEKAGDFHHPMINYGSIRVWDDGVRLEISMTGAGARRFAAMLRQD